MPSFSYLLARLLQIIPTFLLVMIFIFLLVRLLPGDPAIALALGGGWLVVLPGPLPAGRHATDG